MTKHDSSQRITELVNLIAWLVRHPYVAVSEAAAHFNVTEKQLVRDLNMLTFTGPDQFGGGLVDIHFSDGFITVVNAQNIDHPIRLSTKEATAVLGGLAYLKSLPTNLDAQAIADLEGKLQSVMPEALTPLDVLPESFPTEFLTELTQAIANRTCVEISYGSAHDHSAVNRIIEPQYVETSDSHVYVAAWCQTAQAKRTFRFDRILTLKSLDIPFSEHAETTEVPMKSATVVVQAGSIGELEPSSIVSTKRLDQTHEELTIEVGNFNWLAGLIVASAGEVQAKNPPELVELVQTQIARGLAALG